MFFQTSGSYFFSAATFSRSLPRFPLRSENKSSSGNSQEFYWFSCVSVERRAWAIHQEHMDNFSDFVSLPKSPTHSVCLNDALLFSVTTFDWCYSHPISCHIQLNPRGIWFQTGAFLSFSLNLISITVMFLAGPSSGVQSWPLQYDTKLYWSVKLHPTASSLSLSPLPASLSLSHWNTLH